MSDAGVENKDKWHIGKEIPLAVLFAIFMQGAGIIWFVATINSRVATVEARLDTLNDSRDRLVRLEVAATYQSAILGEIKLEIQNSRDKGK
jgi:hypothetical protein